MLNLATQPFAPAINPWKLFIISLIGSLLGFQLVGMLVGMLVAMPFYSGSLTEFIMALSNPVDYPQVKLPLMIVQGTGSAFGLILIPWVIYAKGFGIPLHFGQARFKPGLLLLVVFLMFFFMAVNSPVGEWNQHITFPESLAGLERMLQDMEQNLEVLTSFLVNFNSPWEFLLGMVVVAVIPAIGEELVFRGLVQNHLLRITKNVHVAVWLAAFIFGAIHFQFYGLFPRMLLGVLFGYLYVYSGKLSYAIWAHFLNNGMAVLAMYMHQTGAISFDIEQPGSLPWYQVLISGVICVFLIIGFKQLASGQQSNEQLV